MVSANGASSAVNSATIVFVDLAGFSAISEVFGDESAISILELFERLVHEHVRDDGQLIKWIGDEAMLSFSNPDVALQALGRLLPACRFEPRIPLTRTAVNHGPVIRRGADVYGTTVNIAARIASLAKPGQLLATSALADIAIANGIKCIGLGPTALKSVEQRIPLYSIELAEAADAAWIDPVCKMHAPYSAYIKEQPNGPWFCSKKCSEAYYRSPETYSEDMRSP